MRVAVSKLVIQRKRTGAFTSEYYINVLKSGRTHEGSMQKRLLILPIIWGAYGIGEVIILNYLFGPILNSLPYIPNDKPIGGSYLPALFFNLAAFLAMIGLSLWATGFMTVDWTNPKTKREFGALAVLCGSGFLVFYAPIFLAPLMVSLIYLLAVNIE